MKRLTCIGLNLCTIALFGLGTSVLLAQGNNRGKAEATVDSAHVSIEYGRPMLKGRNPLEMIKPGQVWRLGAGAPTTIDSNRDLLIGGTRVLKGKHILLAQMVERGKWLLLVSSKPANEFKASSEIAETPMKLDMGQHSVEKMTIKVSSHQGQGVIEVVWGTSRLIAFFSAVR